MKNGFPRKDANKFGHQCSYDWEEMYTNKYVLLCNFNAINIYICMFFLAWTRDNIVYIDSYLKQSYENIYMYMHGFI